MIVVNQSLNVDGAQNELRTINWCQAGVQPAVNSHLKSKGATRAAKVDTLIPSPIFHSFLSR